MFIEELENKNKDLMKHIDDKNREQAEDYKKRVEMSLS